MSTVGRNPVKYAGIHRKRLPGITRTRTSYMMYNRKNIYATAIVCCLASGAMCAYGQEESVPEENTARQASETVLTLKDCMEYALANSADIRIQEADNDDLRTARRDAILAAFAPNISANASAHTNFGRAVDPETNTYITSVSFSNAWSVSAGITLFNGFYAVNNLKITRIAQAMGLSMEQQIRDRICLATIEAYYNVVYYTKLSEILEDQTIIHYGVKVKNPNPEHAVQFPVIYVTPKDYLGNDLYTQYATLSAIAAGDTIMYGGTVAYEGEEPATVDVSVGSLDLSGGYILQEESTAIYQDELVVSDVSEQKYNDGKAVKFTGNVTNTSKYDIDGKFVVSVVFFEDDKMIGGFCSYFENLKSGEAMPFELDLSYLIKKLRNYDHYEIYVGQ